MRFWHVSGEMLFHSSPTLSHNSCTPLGGVSCWWSWHLRCSQRCSMGLRSGDWRTLHSPTTFLRNPQEFSGFLCNLQCPTLSSQTPLVWWKSTGVWWKWLESGHCLVIVWLFSSQSLLKSENDWNSLSGQTPVDFDQTMTGIWHNNLAFFFGSLDGLHWTLTGVLPDFNQQASQTTCRQTSLNKNILVYFS